MASSLAVVGLWLFGSAAFAQYAGSPQSNRYQPAAAPPPARSAYAPQPRPAVPPLPPPEATSTWRPSAEPAPIQEILELEKEVPQAVPVPVPLPLVQEPRQPEPVRQHAPVIQPKVQEPLQLAAPSQTGPAITPASYPQPVPIAVSGPAPIQTNQLHSATPMPAAEKPLEAVPMAAPAAPLTLPEPVAVPERQPEPAAELPAVAPPPVLPTVPETVATPSPVVAPLPQPWELAEQPAPTAVAAPAVPEQPAAEVNHTALQAKDSAPVPVETGRPQGAADDGQGNYVQLDPPGPQRLFRLDSETALHERMRQEALSRPGQDKTDFPTYKPLSDSIFAGRSWPGQAMLVEPSYVNYKPLLFQDLNSERYGWDLGFVQPLVSTGYFIKDFVFWPYRRAAHPGCCDSGAGYCLPGDPVPYLLYPPIVSLPGTVAEVAAVAALAAIFP